MTHIPGLLRFFVCQDIRRKLWFAQKTRLQFRKWHAHHRPTNQSGIHKACKSAKLYISPVLKLVGKPNQNMYSYRNLGFLASAMCTEGNVKQERNKINYELYFFICFFYCIDGISNSKVTQEFKIGNCP